MAVIKMYTKWASFDGASCNETNHSKHTKKKTSLRIQGYRRRPPNGLVLPLGRRIGPECQNLDWFLLRQYSHPRALCAGLSRGKIGCEIVHAHAHANAYLYRIPLELLHMRTCAHPRCAKVPAAAAGTACLPLCTPPIRVVVVCVGMSAAQSLHVVLGADGVGGLC